MRGLRLQFVDLLIGHILCFLMGLIRCEHAGTTYSKNSDTCMCMCTCTITRALTFTIKAPCMHSITPMGFMGIKCHMRKEFLLRRQILYLAPLFYFSLTPLYICTLGLTNNKTRGGIVFIFPSLVGVECYIFKNLLILYPLD